MELADVLDSKSSGSDTVPVRPRSPAPKKESNFCISKVASFFMQKYDIITTIEGVFISENKMYDSSVIFVERHQHY